MVLNSYEWYFQIPSRYHALRPVSLPLRTSVVLNGISKYHSGIIATGKCTIENFKGIEWYSIVMNAISKYHSGIIETGKCRPTIEDFSDIGWYYI